MNTPTHKDELVPLLSMLQLAGADVLDLGCGMGSIARRIAAESGALSVTAIDTDAAQTERARKKGGGVKYLTGTAEALPLADASLDAIIMMKSLHHVPISQMDTAFGEMARVLRPSGKVYICEPEYAGDFNDILRLFHDEGEVRAAALAAITRTADHGQFGLTTQADYIRPLYFTSLDDFREKLMNLPWLTARITPEIEARVQAQWETKAAADQPSNFTSRMLIYILQKLN